jgi:hypothetical protein
MDFPGSPSSFPAQKIRREKRPFTTEEDSQLACFVAAHGDHAWNEIERLLPGRTARQYRERWNLYLSPSVSNDPWTAEEDLLLIRLYSVVGPKWTLIAKSFPRRTANNIKNRQKQMSRRAQRATRLTTRGPHVFGFDQLAFPHLAVGLEQAGADGQ